MDRVHALIASVASASSLIVLGISAYLVLLLLGILGAALFLIVFVPFAKRDLSGVAASTWL